MRNATTPEEQGAQFLITSHSPLLMAFPGATLYACADGGVRPIAYEQIERVRLTRDFLRDPARYLRRL